MKSSYWKVGFVVLLVIALIWCMDNASATENKPSPPPNTSSVGNVEAQGISSASIGSTSVSVGDAQNTISFEAADIPDNTPDVSLGSLFPSADCMGAANFGGSVAGFGVGGGKTYVNVDCEKRETARSFAAFGRYVEAIMLLCATQAARESMEKCPADPVPPPQCDTGTCEAAASKVIQERVDRMREIWQQQEGTK